MKKAIFVLFIMASALIVSCGSDHVLDEQSHQRDALGPEIAGIWKSRCQGKQVVQLNFANDHLTVDRLNYFDPECVELSQTTRTTGAYKLSNNFKTGINNTIVYDVDQEVRVTLNTEYDVDAQNNNLAKIQNTKEVEIDPKLTPVQKKEVARENLRIRSAKELKNWKKDEEKVLNRLQAEKLATMGVDNKTAAEMGSRASILYQVDNGYLQLTGGADFAHAFARP